MTVSVTFGGQSYDIPEDGESGWESLTNYLVALASASLATTGKQAIRTATITPITVSAASDYCVIANVGSAAAATLPTGVTGQIFVIADGSGSARTNAITVSTTGGALIDGAATYVLAVNYGVVAFQFDGTGWKVLWESPKVLKGPLSVVQSTTNASFVESGITGASAFPTVTNLQSCSASFDGSKEIMFSVALSNGKSMLCHTSYNASTVSALSDPDGMFLPTDSGTGFVVTKSAGSATVTFKNRMGVSVGVEIQCHTNYLSAITAWS